MKRDPILSFESLNLPEGERAILWRILPGQFRSVSAERRIAIFDTLFFIYTAANSGIAIHEGDADALPFVEDLFASGLVDREGDDGAPCIRTTPRGEILGSYLALARIREAIGSPELAGLHPLVPILFAGRRKDGLLKRVFPSEHDEEDSSTDLPAFLPSDVFEQFVEFCRTCVTEGCAILCVSSLDAKRDFIFPPEFALLLTGLIERLDESDYAVWSRRASLLESAMALVSALSCSDCIQTGSDARDQLMGLLEGSGLHFLQETGDRIVLSLAENPEVWESCRRRLVQRIRHEIRDAFSSERGGCWICEDAGELKEKESGAGECHLSPDKAISIRSDAPMGTAGAGGERGKDPGRMSDLRILLGYSDSGEAVFWEPCLQNNGHFVVIGGSGAGKTETLRVIATELERQYYPTLLIDFHGDMLPKGSNAVSYRIREGSGFYFNPLELDPLFPDITPLRATSDFLDALSINFPTLGIQQRRRIKEIVKQAFRMHGITSELETWSREMPFDAIEEGIMSSDDESLIAYLEDIFDYQLFSGTTRLSMRDILHRGTTHIQLSALPESLRYLFADLMLRRLFYSLQALGEIPRDREDARSRFRLFVVVDEAKLLVSQKAGQKQVIKAVLNKYATEMRKFGVGLILASQLISHFNDEILANIAVKFCMRTENRKQAMENSRYFEISESDLMNFAPGEGIIAAGSRRTKLKVLPLSRRGS